MFRQLVTPPGVSVAASTLAQQHVNSLFTYHPLQIAAIVETVWRNRYTGPMSPFVPWPWPITRQILDDKHFITGYQWPVPPALPGPPSVIDPTINPPAPLAGPLTAPLSQPGITGIDPLTGRPSIATNWDHLIWAYLVENTRIFDIFCKVLETYTFSEELETPSPASQLFWRNLECLIYGDALPTMVWTTSGRTRRDETANRLTVYYWMFGIDLSHAPELVEKHPYQKPAASNRDFIPTLEAMLREVWRGIINANNSSGPNDADPAAIATLARRIYDMMATRRLNGNMSREEFRAVSVMSFMWLAIAFDSPVVQDLRATASSPEQRLIKIAERVGMRAHSRTKPLLDLAHPLSVLMQSIEANLYNSPSGAALLYKLGTSPERNVEQVIDQYYLATGHDLKAQAVASTQRATTSPRTLPAPQRTPQRGNGRPTKLPVP